VPVCESCRGFQHDSGNLGVLLLPNVLAPYDRDSTRVQGRVSLATPDCNESLHFVGLAISACLLPSLPCPTCTADSSAGLTATAPVRSLVHAWPCSAPLQPLVPVPFPTPPLLVIFCAHLTFHHSLSCPISYFLSEYYVSCMGT
jgi:hypothetical protein